MERAGNRERQKYRQSETETNKDNRRQTEAAGNRKIQDESELMCRQTVALREFFGSWSIPAS